MRVYLIGFMGCGKTKLGRKLAPEMGLNQVDLDHFIEESMFMSIPQIFEQHGEDEFRKMESSKLKEVATFNDVLISTGGGAPCYFDNMQAMNETGVTLYIKLKPKKLAKRLLKSKNERPLIKGKDKDELIEFIKFKLQERKAFYKKAHLILDPDDFEIDELATLIKDKHKELFGA